MEASNQEVWAALPGENRRLATIAVILTGVLLIMSLPAFQGRMYFGDDLNNFFLPFKLYFARCLSQGLDSDWCPNVFCGFYLQGDGQVAMYHPLVRLAYGCLPFSAAFNLEFLIRYPLLLLGTFLLLRRWGLPRDASLIGAMTFAFSGFNLLHHLHLNAIEVIAHLPFLLLAIDCLLRGGSSRGAAWAWLSVALLTASQVLFAYPQYLLFTGLAELAYAAALRGGRMPLRILPALAAAKLLGVLIGGVQLLPTLEALRLSDRAAPTMDFKCSYSLHPANLVQVLSPYFFSEGYAGWGPEKSLHEFGIYNGVLATISVVWLLLRWRHLGAWRPLVAGLLAAAAVATVLALGRYGQLYKLQALLPVVGVFRCPCRYILLAHLATAMMTAVAVADLLRLHTATAAGPRREPRALWLLPVLAAVVSSGGVFLHFRGSGKFAPLVAGPWVQLGCAALIAGAVTLVAMTARGWRGAFTALVLLSTGSQAWYGLHYFWQKSTRTLAEVCAAAPLAPPGGYRTAAAENEVIFNNVRSTTGYSGVRPKPRFDYSQPAPRQVAGVAGAPTAVPLPYVRLVSQAIASQAPARDLASIDVRTTALVEKEIALPGGPPGAVTLVIEQPGRLVMQTTTATEQLLVVSESMHPGWKAVIDGCADRALRVNGDWLGCIVPAGTHNVELLFRPWSLYWGSRLSIFGLVLTLIIFWAALYRTRDYPLPTEGAQPADRRECQACAWPTSSWPPTAM